MKYFYIYICIYIYTYTYTYILSNPGEFPMSFHRGFQAESVRLAQQRREQKSLQFLQAQLELELR